MKITAKIALTTLIILVISTRGAFCAVLDSTILKNQIKNDITNKISSFFKEELDVKILDLPYKSININEKNYKINTDIDLNALTPLTIAKVNIEANGKILKTFGVPVKLSIYDNVYTASCNIRAGEELSSSNISIEKKDITLNRNSVMKEDFSLQDIISKKSYNTGDIIDKRFTEKEPDVVKNTIVSVIFKDDDVAVTLTCLALESGKKGNYIRVRSKQFKKDYLGKVIDTSTILVEL